LAVADKKELNDTVFHEEKNLSPQIKDEITLTRQKKEKSAFKNKHETETNKKIELPKTNKKIAKKLTVVDNAAEKEDKIIIDDVVVGDESEVIADIDKVEKEETKDVEEKLQTKAYATATKSTIVSGAPASSQKNKNKLGSFSDRSKVQSAEADEVIVKLEEEGVTSDVFYVVDEMPKFKGKGLDEFRKYIQKKLIYPQSAAENGITGRVYISFVVSKKGKIKDVKVVRSVSSVLDKEAIRVVKSSPLWTPGKQSGKNIKVAYTVPIEFKLQ
jgi:protein TonB